MDGNFKELNDSTEDPLAEIDDVTNSDVDDFNMKRKFMAPGKRKTAAVEKAAESVVNFLNSKKDKEDPEAGFFKSLLHNFNTLNMSRKFEFKMEALQAMNILMTAQAAEDEHNVNTARDEDYNIFVDDPEISYEYLTEDQHQVDIARRMIDSYKKK